LYPVLKYLHICLALLSLGGFLLRGAWMLRTSEILRLPAVRILPHFVDTALLLSGISLVFMLQLPLMQSNWLQAKLVALLFYIVLGTIALKRGRTLRIRITALLLALATFGYIAGVAVSKSPYSWLATTLHRG
jgi:uncharacterized membrane protein SirB2